MKKNIDVTWVFNFETFQRDDFSNNNRGSILKLTHDFRIEAQFCNWICLLKCWQNKISYDLKIYLHSIKINLYSVKYIFIISTFFSWNQNISLLNQNKFVFSKKCFYHVFFFHWSQIFFHCMNFLFNTFLVSISGLPFVFAKVRILLSVCKLNRSSKV